MILVHIVSSVTTYLNDKMWIKIISICFAFAYKIDHFVMECTAWMHRFLSNRLPHAHVNASCTLGRTPLIPVRYGPLNNTTPFFDRWIHLLTISEPCVHSRAYHKLAFQYQCFLIELIMYVGWVITIFVTSSFHEIHSA